MNEQNQSLKKSETRTGWRRHPILFTALACFATGIVVFLATFFSVTVRYRSEIEDYRAHYVRISDKYDVGLIETALGLLDSDSVFDLPDRETLTEAMIEAAITAMGDRYGTFFTDAEYASYSTDLSGSFFGIGVTLQKTEDGNARIVLVHKDSPAEREGLLAGDEIVSVDGVLFSDGYETAFEAIAGEKGSVVEVVYLRGGAEGRASIPRGEVIKQTVVSRIETYGESRIGYVNISGFDGHTYEQCVEAISELEAPEADVDALIFDLRQNGGGLLTEVSKTLAYLLPDGVIAYVDYRSESLSDYTISAEDGYVKSGSSSTLYCEGGHRITLPAAVLVDGNTASAAELFTASLRDWATPDFGSALDVTVVGTTTYGKGTVQTTYALGSGYKLKMTLAHYNPASNVNYDGVGITPDVVRELTEDEAAISVFLRTQENDPQLSAALALLDQKVNP
ncbi:MAG: PDZ domain-containing protein [Clostridia bacterium]|nr:PDZ domain-containing protein [Clostridia bacterium]